MEDLLSDDILTLTNKMEDITRRLKAWNETTQRCRNLSLAVTAAEEVEDKLGRILRGQRN